MLVTLLRSETRDRASAWFIDAIPLIVVPLLALPVAWRVSEHIDLPWWVIGLVALVASLRLVRIEIRRGDAFTTVRSFWFGVVPGRRHDVPAIHADESWGADGPDEITLGDTSFACYKAGRVAAWLQGQQLRLAETTIPEARVVASRRSEDPT